MGVLARYGLALALALFLGGWVAPAHAWVETSVRSNTITLDVGRDGQATVTHELILRIRGGPLKSFAVPGVDRDAEPLPNATVSSTGSAQAGSVDLPLLLAVDDQGTLKLEVDHERGLRRGTYLMRFSYRTSLLAQERLAARGGSVLLSWVGPRLDSGVDSAKVVFRLPQAHVPPRVPDAEQPADGAGLSEEFDGVFLSQLRREADVDVLEVVRPHVAKGEPVVWRVLTAPAAFDAFKTDAGPRAEAPRSEEQRDGALWLLVAAGVAGLVYACLVALKAHWVSLACQVREARARSLVPLPTALRSALSGALLASALGVGVGLDHPTGFGVLLVLAMLAAAQLGPLTRPAIRGPGTWRVVEPSGLRAASTAPLPGRFLDTGAWPGFILFALSLTGFGALAVYAFQRSAYLGMMTALGAACLLPLFCTGRASELPPDPILRPRRLFHYLVRRLARRRPACDAQLLGRFPGDTNEPDELRLAALPRRPIRGLNAIEVCVEYHLTGPGRRGAPCVMVRVQDESPAYLALPRGITWTRGRGEDERVAVLRPKLPTRAMTLALVERLLTLLSRPERAEARPKRRAHSPRAAGAPSGAPSSRTSSGAASNAAPSSAAPSGASHPALSSAASAAE
ncbi:MAG: hypothetical protein KIT72_00965 [Polyangiaceae bacterium]|nr:hypothetical protein [Polyangiaceae bacterium]MCW5788967.1 hypothetical protein [Polyangiaceae bacterium]